MANPVDIFGYTRAEPIVNKDLTMKTKFAATFTDLINNSNLISNLAENVAAAEDSEVAVTSPNATNLATVITLANETKGDVNQLVADLNNVITQLNAFLEANKNAGQMAPDETS